MVYFHDLQFTLISTTQHSLDELVLAEFGLGAGALLRTGTTIPAFTIGHLRLGHKLPQGKEIWVAQKGVPRGGRGGPDFFLRGQEDDWKGGRGGVTVLCGGI